MLSCEKEWTRMNVSNLLSETTPSQNSSRYNSEEQMVKCK
jgi:hypothetical protein